MAVAAALAGMGLSGGYIVPSRTGEVAALFAALVAGVVFGLFAAKDRSFRADNSYYKALSLRFGFVADPKLRIPAFALLGFVVTFLAVERCGIALWTYAEGNPGQRIVTVSSYNHPSRNRLFCNGFYLREAPFMLAPAICTAQYLYPGASAPGPGAKLRVYGRATAFGITPDGFDIVSSS